MRVVDVRAPVTPPGVVDAMRSGSAPDHIRLETAGTHPWVVHRHGYR